MIRSISTIALAATGALLLSACGSDKTVSLSNKLVSCENNAVNLPGGGYVWTWVDNANKASITPITGYTASESFTPEPSDLVIDGKPAGKACHVSGSVPAKPRYDDTTSDTTTDPCGEKPVYPTTGMGFSFQDKNAVYDVCTKAGITFWAKAGDATTTTIRVSFPTSATDVPNTTPTNPKAAELPAGQEDKFTKECLCGTEAEAQGLSKNDKTCFSNVYEDITVTTTWQPFTVYFGDTVSPGFMGVVPFDGTKGLKVQFEAFAPETGDPVPFNFWIDEVSFIDNPTLDATGKPANWCLAGTGAPKASGAAGTGTSTSTATGTAIAP